MRLVMINILAALFLFGCSFAREPRRALIVIDVQKCFISGGNLAVPSGEDVIPVINGIRKKYGRKFKNVYFSLVYHPANHISFASQHSGKENFDSVTLRYNDKVQLCKPTTLRNETNRAVKCRKIAVEFEQILWPDHCVIGTEEVNLADDLIVDATRDKFIFKGMHRDMDSYSTFFDNGHLSETNLHELLQFDNIDEVFVVGLNTDVCIKFSALDAEQLGYKVYVVQDATRAVEIDEFYKSLEEMRSRGVHIIDSAELENVLELRSRGVPIVESAKLDNALGILNFG